MENETIRVLSKVRSIILRTQFGENPEWQVVTPKEAFPDILASDRWGCDEYVSEAESLAEFMHKCGSLSSWRKTEKFSYIFIDVSRIKELGDLLKKVQNLNSVTSFEDPEAEIDDFIKTL